MEAESPGQDISDDDHGLTEACHVLGSWNTREAKTLKPCLRAPRHGAVVSALTAWRKGKALSVSASWFSKHSCAWTAGGAEREREQEPPALETAAGDITGVGTATRTRCGQRTPCQY